MRKLSNIQIQSKGSSRALFLRSLLLIGFGCATQAPVHAQLALADTLVGAGGTALGQQGFSVGLSADGNTAIVGGRRDSGFQGAAWIFKRTAGAWAAGGTKLATGTGGQLTGQQGSSVAMSADGTTAIVGSPVEGTGALLGGAFWVYVLSGGSFVQQGPILTSTTINSALGFSAALSADGNTAILGAPNDGGVGKAWVYTRSGGVWSLQTKLSGSGSITFGISVSLSLDGNTALVGAPDSSGGVGNAWVFTRSGGVWSSGTVLPTGTPSIASGRQGASVAISGNALTAIVGGYNAGSGVGAAYVYTLAGEVGTLQAQLVGSPATADAQQGYSVAISSDGNRALIGGPNDGGGSGAIWPFTRSGTTWTPQPKLGSTGQAGFSIALSSDGNTALAGAITQGAAGVTLAYGAPDLTITKVHNGTFHRGDNGVTYTIKVKNSGGGPTSGVVTVTDTVPNGLTSAVLSGGGWLNCATSTVSGVTTATCNRSNALAAGAFYPDLTLTANVASSAPSTILNTAKVAGGGQVNTSNDAASDFLTLPAVPDLAITKTHTASLYKGMQNVDYTIRVRNIAGNASTVGAVTVTDNLPAGLSFVSVSAGGSWSCSGGATVSCSRSDALAGGASYEPIVVRVNVSGTAPPSITNTATVGGGGEVNTANNSVNDTAPVAATGPDLTVSSLHIGSFKRNQTGTYYVIVTNAGSVPSQGKVTATDTIPAGLSATAAVGNGWTCTVGAGSVSCTRDDVLPAGLSYRYIAITVSISGGAAASVTNNVGVSGGGDSTPGNNTGTDLTTIIN